MSSPIKPPGGNTPGTNIPQDAVGHEKRRGATGESFRATLDEPRNEAVATEAAREVEGAHAAGSAHTVGEVDGASEVKRIAADLRAGRMDAASAVDALVARALESNAAMALPPAQRTELEAYLRTTLSEDPSLLALTKDLSRGD